MHDIRWAVSSLDTELHYPKDLFHDCDAVRSILGASAPYVIPKVKSEKLLRDIGLKTEVTISDILDILNVWISSGTLFKARDVFVNGDHDLHGVEVVTREAIYYGLVDGSFKYSLVNWALPYAQRYIFSVHPDKYHNFKQFGFDTMNRLQIVVVEKLFYRNVIKNNGGASKKLFKCSCLLQGNVLYTTGDSDSHALYMELSCLFFDGNSELHLANFLHMITTMVESGSAEERMEFFVLNSQKVLKLPAEESIWSLPSSLMENDEYARANCFKTQAAVAHPSRMLNSDDDEDFDTKTNAIDATLPIGNELAMNIVLDPSDKGPEVGASKFNIRDRLNIGTPNVVQALQTGKDGELAAFKHFTRLFGKRAVKWVNEINETGLPFDIVIGEKESETEYIEVKATKSARKDWFHITVREWQFAVEKGETFSVAHVILSGSDAKVTVYKNPVKLCQQGKLQLVVMMPR
ncbi:hypothetical protein Dsin_027483 [Dipteronia sinensis]|uniref:Protein NO VEIN C-terminal domain-containing protein n=1 Tax=Dipteronia sinensis TaxID=43782 RepID=A0AAD9ZP18_9ROSI|nr:hypothetical protein Dsin_027483 [Dipteronia sinensis]